MLFTFSLYSQEICDNGIDDDGDGLIDLNDTVDCACGSSTQPSSLIPNPSFEDHSCCPTTFSQLSCADTWIQATDATSDYFNCGYFFSAGQSAGLSPFPDGTGAVGAIFSPGWQEYVGACLSSPLIAGTSYTLELNIASTPIDDYGGVCNGGVINYGNIDITIFGAPNCSQLPYSTTGCPGGSWYVLTTTTYTPVSSWGTISFTFTPTANVGAVIIGSPCTLPGDYTYGPCYPYFYFDNLILNTTTSFTPVSITQTGNLCSNDLVLTASASGSGTYQWYYGGVAIVGQTGTTLDVSAQGYGAGTYQVMFSDINGCAVAESVVVQDIVTISVDNTQNISCNGSSDGSISITVSGGTSPYSYVWSGPGGYSSTNEDISGLAAGTYNLTVNDANSCNQTTTVTLIEPSALALSTTSIDESCTGFADGSVDLSVSGGAGSYSFSWVGPNGFSATTEDISTLEAGSYSVTVTDANGCTEITSVTITTNPIYTSDFTVISPICETNQSTITYTGSAPSGATYTWDFGGMNIVSGSGQGPYTVTGTGGTGYTITLSVTENGCTSPVTTQTVDVDSQPLANAGNDDEICGDSYTLSATPPTVGSGVWTASPATATFDDDTSPTASVTVSAYGNYTFTWTVTNGTCSDQDAVNITFYEPPIANAGSDDHICGNNYTLSGLSSVGTGTWTIQPASGITILSPHSATSDIIANVYGTYTLTWTEVNGLCSDSATITLTFDQIPTSDFTTTSIPCYGDESIISYTGNGTSGMTYNWDFSGGNVTPGTGQGPHTISWATAGTYTITLSVENNGCISTVTTTDIIQPEILTGTIASTDILCNGDQSGAVDVSVSGGTTPITYLWNTGSTVEDLYGLNGGNYSVTVSDANNCSIVLATTINEPSPLTASIPSTLNLCNGQSEVITPLVTGGTSPYTYSWNNISYPNPTITISPIADTTLSFQVQDANGCTNMQYLNIFVSPELQLDLFVNKDSVCPGDPVIITGNLYNGAGGPYYAFLEGGQVITFPVTYYPIDNGDIIIHVLDRCGSEAVDTAHVGLYPLPPVSFFSDITEGCQPLTIQFNEQSPNEGQSYLWDFGDNENLSFAKNPLHVYTDYGTFDVTLTVTSTQGCTNQLTFEDMITVYKKPHAQFTTFPEIVTVLNSTVQFNNISQDNILNFWYFGDGDSSLVESPFHEYPSFHGNYTVSLIVESQEGCLDTAIETLTVNDVYTFWSPTIFSPDNDGLNDVFFVTGYGIDSSDFHLYVYDRWGEIIFETDKFDIYTHRSEQWDGKTKSQKTAQNGTYSWLCIFNDILGKSHQETGKITLTR